MPHDPESVVSMTSPKTFSPFLTSAVVFKTLLYQKKISELNCGLISLCILLMQRLAQWLSSEKGKFYCFTSGKCASEV